MVRIEERASPPTAVPSLPARRGWVAVAAMVGVLLLTWLPTWDMPFGDSHDGRLLSGLGMRVANFWEKGLAGSSFLADTTPYTSTYAHHPPLPNLLGVAVTALLGVGEAQLRTGVYLMGAATLPAAALLLRMLRIGWGATLLALGTTSATRFFWAYGRLLRGFAPVLLLAAGVVHLRRTPQPSRAAVWGTAAAGALAVLQSWPSAAAAALLGLWLLQGRRLDRVTVSVGVVMTAAAILTVAWVVGISGLGGLVEQAQFRTTGGGFTTTEFVSRQWRWLNELLPAWYLALLPVALAAGLLDRRTRAITAITLVVAAAWTLGVPNGAYIHDYWNFRFLLPAMVGSAALFQWLAERSVGGGARVLGSLAAVGVLVAFTILAAGPAQPEHFLDPAEAGALVAAHAPPASQERAWVLEGIPTPRWVSWYWDLPVGFPEPDSLADIPDSDLVVLDLTRLPGWVPAEVEEKLAATRGDYGLISVGDLETVAGE